MRSILAITFVVFLFGVAGFGQDESRDQKLQKIFDLNEKIKILESDILLPSASDLQRAKTEGFEVFRLMPRERYDNKLTVQGGGSYYSFTTRSHDYQKIAQIGLEQNKFKVGFAGADYGFLASLGKLNLADITSDSGEAGFLMSYRTPLTETKVRSEAQRAHGLSTDGLEYKRNIDAVVGSTYLLRSISFSRADVLVAFSVVRKDADGSMIINWKLIEVFAVPDFIRSQTVGN